MADRKAPRKPAPQGQSREDRLKAALKANMARRKAQARARAAEEETGKGSNRADEESS
ncbi:MAG: hypothetical protein HKN30_11285 [Sulfitobacter sp.]|nr:hypothetical protein [Sulfitobacter sp.]